jgi:hypothetical protein
MSENDKFTEENAENTEQTLSAESETALTESETAVASAEEAPEEEEIAPEDIKIFGMPRHVFHWTALGAAGGYILAGIIGVIGEQLPVSIFATIAAKSNATVWAVVVGAVGYFFSSRAEKKRKAAEEAAKSEAEQ